MVKDILFQGLGGLGMFIFGMKVMSEGLQKVAGKRLRRILEAVSTHRLVAFSVGAAVTAIIQSSSATTVMLIGFVNAGLMNLTQAAGIILGANVGTTVTAQLIAFHISDYALLAVAVGVILRFFAHNPRWRFTGDVLIGFGLLFYGMTIMKRGFAPLREDPTFIQFFTAFDADSFGGIILCVMVGSIMTTLVQSSSATVGITIALASEGLLNVPGSVALILGDNIGTTITAQLATIGSTNRDARRAAWVHSLFNVIGAGVIIAVFPWFVKMVVYITSEWMGVGDPYYTVDGIRPSIPRYIANAHTLFNVVNSLLFLSVLPWLVRAACWIVPPGVEARTHITYLDLKFVDVPEVALQQARKEIHRMGQEVQVTYDSVIGCLSSRDLRELRKWGQRERDIDLAQKELIDFLVRTSQAAITSEESREVSSLMRITNNLERVGDSVENIAQLIEEMFENELTLSQEGVKDYHVISSKAREMLALVVGSILKPERDLLEKAKELENDIDFMREDMRAMYISRLRSGVCTLDPGLIFTDMLANFEKVGDYCFNIAQALTGAK